MADTLIHYKLCGPFCDVTVILSYDDVIERATQLIVYQGDWRENVTVLLIITKTLYLAQ